MTGQIDLSWADNSDIEDGFDVYRQDPQDNFLSVYDSRGANETTYTDTNVIDARSYDYAVAATNAAGSSGQTSTITVSVPLSAPDGLTVATGGRGELVLDWNKNDDNPNGEWQIYRDGAQVATVSDATTTTYTDTGLANNTSYDYFVRRSVNSETADTATVSGTTVAVVEVMGNGQAAGTGMAGPTRGRSVDAPGAAAGSGTAAASAGQGIVAAGNGVATASASGSRIRSGIASGTGLASGAADLDTNVVLVASGNGVGSATALMSYTTLIEGTVTLEGSQVQGATVFIIDDDTDMIVSVETSDANGHYEYRVDEGGIYHATVQYIDGNGNRWTDEANPFIEP